MRTKRFGATLIIMLFVAFLVSSCGSDKDSNSTPANAVSAKESPEEASEEASEAPSDSGSADDNKDSDAGGGNSDTSISVSQSRPDGFPKDIPIVDDAKTLASVTTSDDTSTAYSVSYETRESYDDVVGAYKKYFKEKKYENASEMATEEAMILTGTAGEASIWISVSKNTDGTDAVVVAIIYSAPKK